MILETAIAHWLTWANRNNDADDHTLTRDYILSTTLRSTLVYPNSLGGTNLISIFTCFVDDELGSFDLHLIEDTDMNELVAVFTEVDCTYDRVWSN